jgi:hypothetical protein
VAALGGFHEGALLVAENGGFEIGRGMPGEPELEERLAGAGPLVVDQAGRPGLPRPGLPGEEQGGAFVLGQHPDLLGQLAHRGGVPQRGGPGAHRICLEQHLGGPAAAAFRRPLPHQRDEFFEIAVVQDPARPGQQELLS